jgi:hypothetical protein
MRKDTVPKQCSNHSTGSSPGNVRAAKIKRLAEQANTITAMLATVHILAGDDQVEALLDCSSLADDFARDLDLIAGARA